MVFYQDIVVFEILLIIFSRDYFLAIYLVVLLIKLIELVVLLRTPSFFCRIRYINSSK